MNGLHVPIHNRNQVPIHNRNQRTVIFALEDQAYFFRFLPQRIAPTAIKPAPKRSAVPGSAVTVTAAKPEGGELSVKMMTAKSLISMASDLDFYRKSV